jgi:hypothetical protein
MVGLYLKKIQASRCIVVERWALLCLEFMMDSIFSSLHCCRLFFNIHLPAQTELDCKDGMRIMIGSS